MKQFALAAALALATCGAAQGAVVELSSDGLVPVLAPAVSAAGLTPADLAVIESSVALAPAGKMSELPEPEVFAMMLVGLCLIGYRASRVSDEKFT